MYLNDFENDYEDFEFDDEEELEVEDRGVTDLVDDEEYEAQLSKDIFYKGFPILEDIIGEKTTQDYIPEGYTDKQKALFGAGIKKIKQINKKYGCNLSFNEFVADLDNHYDVNSKKLPKKLTLTDVMSIKIWKVARDFSIKMEEKTAYATFSREKIEKDLKSNFNEISSVLRLYAKMHPEKFPIEDRISNAVFTSKGKLRNSFKTKDVMLNFDIEDEADILREKTVKTSERYFGKFSGPEEAKTFIVNQVKSIINGKNEVISSQGDRVQRLAECVRFLRPLQARRDQRSFLQFFTKHDIYVAERDALRQCKEEMKRLGLDRKEISKVLHGKAFNDVKFYDGMTVREKQADPTKKDFVEQNGLLSDNVSEVSIEEKKFEKMSIIVEGANDANLILDNEILEDSSVKSLDSSISK